MNQFIAYITLPEYFDEDFVSLIPEQRAQVDTLLNEGTFASYSLSLDRSKLWVVMNVKNEREAERIIKSFPIADYISYEIIPLMFHNTATVIVPHMSLN
ncbi:MAG: muconolactone Delta-isomerase family protein [Bacteroidota bacterium]|nr:muconolactone Delta-isomerase family protein [Bacteroidota bacterium]